MCNSAPLCNVHGRVLGKLHGHGCVTQSCCYQSVSVYFYEMGFSSKEKKKKKEKQRKPSFRNSKVSLLALRSAMHDLLGAGDKGASLLTAHWLCSTRDTVPVSQGCGCPLSHPIAVSLRMMALGTDCRGHLGGTVRVSGLAQGDFAGSIAAGLGCCVGWILQHWGQILQH